MIKKYLTISNCVFSFLFIILAIVFSTVGNENRLLEFCSSLEIGQSKQEIFVKAKELKGSRFNKFSDLENNPQLISKGFMYATCSMRFENEVLIEKILGVS